MVYESCSGVPVPTDGYSLVNSVGVNGTDIVQLIAHPTRSGMVKFCLLLLSYLVTLGFFFPDEGVMRVLFSLSLH